MINNVNLSGANQAYLNRTQAQQHVIEPIQPQVKEKKNGKNF